MQGLTVLDVAMAPSQGLTVLDVAMAQNKMCADDPDPRVSLSLLITDEVLCYRGLDGNTITLQANMPIEWLAGNSQLLNQYLISFEKNNLTDMPMYKYLCSLAALQD